MIIMIQTTRNSKANPHYLIQIQDQAKDPQFKENTHIIIQDYKVHISLKYKSKKS